MYKRLIALMAVLAIILTFAAGCNGGSGDVSGTPDTGTDSIYDTPGGKKYDEVVEVTTIRGLASNITFENGDSIEDNVWTRQALEEYNIKITYKWTVPNSEYAEKFQLMLSSGDMPDYFFGTADNFDWLHKEGQLKDITDYADQYLSQANKAILASDNGAAQELVTVNGRRFGIVQPAGHESNAYIMWIRKDWLDNLGLDIPRTIDDLEAVLKSFKEDDPAGTGEDNYIPLGVSNEAWTGSIKGLMNSLGAYKAIWTEKDGKYAYSSIQPEMKTALQTLANWYKLGYISPTYYNAGDDRIVELMGYNRMGVAMANYVSGVLIKNAWKKTGGEWVACPLPSATGEVAPSQIETAANTYWYITSACQHPDAVMKLFNMYTDKIDNEYSTFGVSESGIELHNYFYPKLSNANENMNMYLKFKDVLASGDTSSLNQLYKERFDSMQNYRVNGSENKDDWSMNIVYGPGGALEAVYENYFSTDNYIRNAWGGANTAGMNTYWAQLLTFENETFQAIITGEKPIDYFDTFVAEWKRMGGDQITTEVNNALK
ncbi:MAG: extracellular solute-binding protein [Clostridia bacterium]|nr:extracellular solute-binding protein [Clostridia bacterium]